MLVDREAELATLSAALAESARGTGAFAVVHGATALGKTELLHALRTRATEHGFTVRTALGSPTEQPFPYALVDQLVPELALLATESDQDEAQHTVPPHVLRRIYHATLALAADRPLLLCVDDLHYADHASQQCLLYLVRRLRTTRAALVVTEAPHGTAHRTLLAELQYQPRTRHLFLSPLTPRGITRLLAHHLGEPAAARPTAEFHRLTGGNPLLLRALLDDAAATAGTVPRPGAAYRSAVLACAHRSGAEALAVARATAVLGTTDTASAPHPDAPRATGTVPPTSPDSPDTALLAATAALAPRVVPQALAALTASALHDDHHRPRHPAVAEALLADPDLSSAAHTALRARAARALHAQGAPAVAVAAQLMAGAPLGESWEAPALRAAAEEHLAAGDTTLAARYLRCAVFRADDSPQGLADRLATVAVAWRLDPPGVITQLRALAGHARTGLLPPRAILHLVQALLWHGREEDAITAAGTLPDEDADPRYATELAVTRLRLTHTYPGTLPWMPAVLRRPSPAPEPTDPPEPVEVAAARTLHTALTGGDPDAVATAAERVLRTPGIVDHRPDAVVVAIQALVYIDRLDAADAWSDRFLAPRPGFPTPTPVREALLHQTRSFVLLRRGEPAAACEHGAHALDLMPEAGWGTALAFPLAVLAEAHTALGEHDRAAELLDRPLPEATHRTIFTVPHQHARGLHHLALDRPRDALACFVSCGETLRSWGLDTPALAPWRTGAAEAWLALGRPERAVRLLDDRQAAPVHRRPRARAGALRVLAATEPPERRAATLTRALELYRACGDRYGISRTLADLDTAAERHRTPAPAPGVVLTTAERRVAVLAAQGLSNREVAAELSIAVSTVEQHLTRVYRKYRIRHRRELRTRLAAGT
ncbi:AAA family ATPase [Streptomyces mobaraensis NBRC 13819 = DSM 40847]|uniref:Transcriptional regulator n=1 Tax=Streptomyces mobaraensis (strain ATCC 29032 / DSM 40847 / JCM 4168 / NBRC 13819 / NCIMB 11159 / IPCR 16-22) TaxID=1223523 RepID=M3C1W7_STRM1|nr:AAA family ATPase [Streptomyces mobaraensis]EME98000.1 transcriptional regulator [Streptomyces mobaraensis NBRC 13819 = DSM 40847]QTT74358.1 AAA family ATPase [Streptomyces mobaraensis NBRC 13819 = DSM 40847]